jgi:hypothetical protein
MLNIISKELNKYGNNIYIDIFYDNKLVILTSTEELSFTININMLYNLPNDIWSVVLSKIDDIESIDDLIIVYPIIEDVLNTQQFYKSYTLTQFKGLNYFTNHDFRKNGANINWLVLLNEIFKLNEVDPKKDGLNFDISFDNLSNIIFNIDFES